MPIIETAHTTASPQQTNVLNVNNVTVTLSAGATSGMVHPSAISLGGANGEIANGGQQDYGNLTVTADRNTTINVNTTDQIARIYVRTDSNGALSKANSAATIDLKTTSTGGSTSGILAESFDQYHNDIRGNSEVNLFAGSSITIEGDNYLFGVRSVEGIFRKAANSKI